MQESLISKKKLSNLVNRPKVKSWQALFHTQQTIFSYLDRSLAKEGCSVPRFRILFNLYFNGPHTPIQLSKILNVSRANMTAFLSRLKVDGLVKSSHEGGTAKRPAYVLTKKGENHFEEVLPSHTKRIEKILEPFPDKFLNLLEEIRDAVPED